MILTKQLELPAQGYGDFPYVSPQTPRTNLVKELEKYNRPANDSGLKSVSARTKDPVSADRPSIVAKQRPLPKLQYRYEPVAVAPMNLSTKTGFSLPPPSPTGSVSSTGSDQSVTLDLSMKRSSQEIILDDEALSDSSQDEPVDFSKKSLELYENGISVGGGEDHVTTPMLPFDPQEGQGASSDQENAL